MALTLTWRPIKVWPDHWEGAAKARPYSPFSAGYSATVLLLERELGHLGATQAFLQVDATDADIRQDGQLRANAKVNHPGVILTAVTARHGTLSYPCDRFGGTMANPGWQANLRAIALGLEALRKVERYGIAELGQQYAGFRELGSGEDLTVQAAVQFIGEQANANQSAIEAMLVLPEIVAECYRLAVKRVHPDNGGDPALFRQLIRAKFRLDQYHRAAGR